MPQELLEMSDVEVIELTVRNWDEVYEDLSKRLKVKPQGGAVMSKHLKMAGMLSKMESAIKEGQGEKAKDIYQGDEQLVEGSLRCLLGRLSLCELDKGTALFWY